MKVHSVVLCRKFHPNDEYHRRTAVIFGNFLSPTSQRPTLKSYSSEGHPRTRSFSSVPQGYMPCGEILGLLFCLTCFVRAEEVQFEEAPKSATRNSKIEKNRKILVFHVFGKLQSRSKVKKRPQNFALAVSLTSPAENFTRKLLK